MRSLGLDANLTRRGAMDRVTKRVARMFDVPMALVTVWTESISTLSARRAFPNLLADSREASRAESVCGHLVASNEVVVVEDLARDRRFAGNVFLKANGLRFYAGRAPPRAGRPADWLALHHGHKAAQDERTRIAAPALDGGGCDGGVERANPAG